MTPAMAVVGLTVAELGRWERGRVDQTIYHKNLARVAYVFAETAGRPPADVVVDVQADRVRPGEMQPGAVQPDAGQPDSGQPDSGPASPENRKKTWVTCCARRPRV